MRRNWKILAVAVGATLMIGFTLFWSYGRIFHAASNPDCGLGDVPGERLSVRQGTVANFGSPTRISLGVVAVKDGKASLSLRSDDPNVPVLNSVLGVCDYTEYKGYMIYVLSAANRPELPFSGTGSSDDTVRVLIVRDTDEKGKP